MNAARRLNRDQLIEMSSSENSSSTVGFNVPPNTIIIGHIGDDFYGSDNNPTNSVKALKDILR